MSGERSPVDAATVCIIGAGAAGALLADALAGRGHDVVVLEAGPSVDREARVERHHRQVRPGTTADEIWGMDGERDAYTTTGEHAWPLNRRRVKAVGGTTLNWLGVSARFRRATFEHGGGGVGWPLGYDDLQPYYAAAERELGVAGDADAPFQPPRDAAYPNPPMAPSRSDERFRRAARELGLTLHSLPVARGPTPVRTEPPDSDRPAQRVQPPEARYSADTHVERAISADTRLIDRAPVQQLEHGPDGETVTAAHYRTPDGSVHRQEADVFVAACGTVETARLLLLSDSPQHPDGLANSSATVGRYLMGQPPATVLGLLDGPTDQRQRGTVTTGSYEFADDGFSLTCLQNAGETPAELALERREWGDRLLKEVQFHHGNSLGLSIRAESLPKARNRVALSERETDDAGHPAPAVRFEPGDHAQRAQRAGLALGEQLIEALDGTVVYADGTATDGAVPRSAAGGHHALGGTRMGTDPAESVVDPHCRCHDLDNLYVAGGSVFPTSGSVPPALTIAALALRTADHIDERL